MNRTSIEWTAGEDGTPGATWNPVSGCSKISKGCDHCYAASIARRFAGTPAYPNGFDVTLHPDRLDLPLRWKKPKRIFVNSTSDLFHHDIPDGFIGDVWNTMALAEQHTFLILTKRPARARTLLSKWAADGWYWRRSDMMWCGPLPGPLPNVMLGVSVEDQWTAERRIPHVLATPATVRFVSAEPLLGPIDLIHLPRPDLVIVGGESGPGARPVNLDWIRSIRDQCARTDTDLFVKQLGSVWARENGHRGKGNDMAGWPEDLRIRQMPESAVS
jgi:protein gp37